MINLLSLLTADPDAGAPGITVESGDESDFLALLSGARDSAETGRPLKTLPAALTANADETRPAKASVTQWLLQQETAHAPVTLPEGTTADPQALLSKLASHLKNDKPALKPQDEDYETEVQDDASLAGINALIAMLPAASPAQASSAPVSEATAALNGLPPRSDGNGIAPQAADDLQTMAPRELLAAAQNVPQPAPASLKVETDSAPAPTAPGVPVSALSPAPVQTAAPLPPAAVHAVVGSPDWQQSVSQHITLFTRQGQQTAELRLHPEELGQVHISVKLDDNQAQIQMISSHSHVRAALEAALPVLRAQLADSGIQLGQSNISSESFAGQQQQHSSGQQTGWRAATAANNEEEEGLIASAALQPAARGDGRVDIFA